MNLILICLNKKGGIILIPKKIHYCWFGGNPLPDDVKKYIATWKEYCPDYEIIEWNEQNFDISCNDYVREAYEAKKWAFVADYARLKVLYDFGGIYMDTDVELVKSFDNLLNCKAFMCFENDRSVSIGTLGTEKNSSLVLEFLSAYQNRHFLKKNGSYDTTTNLKIVTNILTQNHGLKTNGNMQILGDVYIYPMDYFIAKSYRLGWIQRTNNTYAIHHYSASWVNDEEKLQQELLRKYASDYMKRVEEFVLKLAGLRIAYESKGYMGVISKIMNKINRKILMSIRGGHERICYGNKNLVVGFGGVLS